MSAEGKGSALNEHDGVGGDAFFATGEAEAFGGGGLDADVVRVGADDVGEALLHLWDMGVQLRALGTDGGVEVDEAVALLGYQADGLAEDDLAVDTIGLGSGVGEVVADVAHVGGPEQGVADGMQQHVGITVAQQAKAHPLPMRGEIEWNLDASHPQLASLNNAMDVITESYTNIHKQIYTKMPLPWGGVRGGLSFTS